MLLDTTLADLIIIIILHLVLLGHLIWLIALRRLLFEVVILNVGIFNDYLLAFLFYDCLLRFLLHLRNILCLNSMHSNLSILLLGRNSLFLFRWTLIAVFISIFVVQKTL